MSFKDLTPAQQVIYLDNLVSAIKYHEKFFQLGELIIKSHKEILTLRKENKDAEKQL